MHRAHAFLLVPTIAIGLGGCVLKKTPTAKAAPAPPKPAATAAPAPPPEPLSAPQTTVQLPPPQPLTAEALQSMQPPETTPAPPPPPRSRPSGSRRDTNTQRPPVEAPPPVVAPPTNPEPERPPLQEQLPPTEIKRLQEEATARKTQARQLVDQARRHHLSRQQNGMVERINTFLKQADDAERRGDMRQASELAERALVLARALNP
jgi:hypothetical protein